VLQRTQRAEAQVRHARGFSLNNLGDGGRGIDGGGKAADSKRFTPPFSRVVTNISANGPGEGDGNRSAD